MSPTLTFGLDVLRNPKPLNLAICLLLLPFLIWQGWCLVRSKSTILSGPPSESWIFGLSRKLFESEDPALLLEEWAEKYGPVFRIPLALGSSRVVLCDPKAVAHFYARESTGFRMTAANKIFIEILFGRGIIVSEGDSHKRQRKALTPAFSNQAIRALTTVFYDSAHKLKVAWDATLDASPSGEAMIDVQGWMNKVSLDTIGIGGFAHDFGTIQGQRAKVADIFDSFTRINPRGPSYLSLLQVFLIPVLPLLTKIPNPRTHITRELNDVMAQISNDLLIRMKEETEAERSGEGKGPKSIIETLIIAQEAQCELKMSEIEVLSQVKTLILAGYETTSISLTFHLHEPAQWALINLSLQPETQNTLRTELSQFMADPTFDQLNNSLPYLDAVMKETLRLHPPVSETIRYAACDEIIPLSFPFTTPQGDIMDRIKIAAGTTVGAPIRLINRSKAIWGKDAHEFLPARWMASEAGIPDKAKEIHGYSHLLTFVDGPRTCLGRQFAIMEFKAVLATLIRHYQFSLKDGADTKFGKVVGILPRPKIVGEEGSSVPLLVKRLD